jgi:hypothetical protein
LNKDGGKKSYKLKLVVKMFAQKKGIVLDEIFSLFFKMASIITILIRVEIEYLHIKQLDVRKTFIHGDLEEDMSL